MSGAVWRKWQVILLGLKFVNLEILSTSFIDFLYDKLEELSQDLWALKGWGDLWSHQWSFLFILKLRKYQGLKYTNQELPYVYSLMFRRINFYTTMNLKFYDAVSFVVRTLSSLISITQKLEMFASKKTPLRQFCASKMKNIASWTQWRALDTTLHYHFV